MEGKKICINAFGIAYKCSLGKMVKKKREEGKGHDNI